LFHLISRYADSLTQRRLLGKEIVHIKIGKEKQDFGVNKQLISHYSPYFKAAFTSGFQEAKTGIMNLPETEPQVFDIFYEWLYSQRLWSPDDEEEDRPDTDKLAKLYVFADMAAVPHLQNQVLTALHEITALEDKFLYHMLDYI
jgi:hypothetical protein